MPSSSQPGDNNVAAAAVTVSDSSSASTHSKSEPPQDFQTLFKEEEVPDATEDQLDDAKHQSNLSLPNNTVEDSPLIPPAQMMSLNDEVNKEKKKTQ